MTEKVEVFKQEVELALKERIFPTPTFGLQILIGGDGEISGAKLYLPLEGFRFNPENGDILLGKKVIFPNGILGKIDGVYVQVRLARYIVPGVEVIKAKR